MSGAKMEQQRRHPDFISIKDFKTYRQSTAIWINKHDAIFTLSVFEHGVWTVKVKEILGRWKELAK